MQKKEGVSTCVPLLLFMRKMHKTFWMDLVFVFVFLFIFVFSCFTIVKIVFTPTRIPNLKTVCFDEFFINWNFCYQQVSLSLSFLRSIIVIGSDCKLLRIWNRIWDSELACIQTIEFHFSVFYFCCAFKIQWTTIVCNIQCRCSMHFYWITNQSIDYISMTINRERWIKNNEKKYRITSLSLSISNKYADVQRSFVIIWL